MHVMNTLSVLVRLFNDEKDRLHSIDANVVWGRVISSLTLLSLVAKLMPLLQHCTAATACVCPIVTTCLTLHSPNFIIVKYTKMSEMRVLQKFHLTHLHRMLSWNLPAILDSFNKDLSNKTSWSTVHMVPKFVHINKAPRLIISGVERQRFDVVLFYKRINLHPDEILYLIQDPRTRVDFENWMKSMQTHWLALGADSVDGAQFNTHFLWKTILCYSSLLC